MKKLFHTALFFCLLTGSLGFLSAQEGTAGVVDLQHRVFSDQDVVSLRENWLFFEDQFIDPPPGGTPPRGGEAVSIPHRWMGENRLGYGSYYVKLLLPPRLDRVAINMGDISASYRLYGDGELLDQAGEPAASREEAKMVWKRGVVLARPGEDRELVLILHVANWEDRSGGIVTPLTVGTETAAYWARLRMMMVDVFLFGALLLMCIYHAAQFAFRPQDKGALVFSLLVFVLAMRIFLYGELLILEIFPVLSWQALMKLGYLSFSLATVLFPLFMVEVFPRIISPRMLGLVIGPGILYSLVILFTPVRVFSRFLLPFQFYAVLVALFLLVLLGLALRRGKQGAVFLFIGFCAVFMALINDILVSQGLYSLVFMIPYGILVLVISQSLVLARQYSSALATAEEAADELKSVNLSLERFLPREFLSLLRRESILDVKFGDYVDQEMTLLLLDIRGFTSLSENLLPEDNFRFLNSFLKQMGPLVRQRGGFIDKYLGDGFMALFPHSLEDAALAALEMREKLVEYNDGRERAGYEPVQFGIGIDLGKLLLGTVGENERMDGSVISEAVHRVTDLERLTKKYGVDILVSSTVKEHLRNRGFTFIPKDDGVWFLQGKA